MALRLDGTRFVDRLADDVHDATERLVADRHRDRRAGVGHFLAAHQTFGRIHGDGAHGVLAEVLRDLEHEPIAVVLGLERIQNLRQVTVELHVDDGARHLAEFANVVCHFRLQQMSFSRPTA